MKSDEMRNGAGSARGPAASAPTALGPGPGPTGTAVLPGTSSERLAIGSGTAGESGSHDGMAAVERDEVGSGQIIDGRYRIVKKLGEGGMGEVYAAEHVHIEKRVAIKLLRHEILAHPEAVSRFHQEARSASSIGHENIISIEDFGKLEDGRIYLCMELLDGKPLNDLLQEQPLPPERVLNILIQTCHGLAAAHRKGIVHRDMKPENIFVTVMPSGAEVPKILDFGIAKVQGNEGGSNNLTRTGTIFGTPYYMSPEQALGQRVDHRADIYAMGVIMYECFTGSIPFSGESFMGILTKHITAEPTPPAQRALENGRVLPAGIEPIILRAMKKNPEERQNTMDELVQELVAVHRNLVGPGMSSYMEAHNVSSAAFSAPGYAGGSLPGLMSGIGPGYRPGSSTPVPPTALPTPTPFPGTAAPATGSISAYDGRYPSQPLPSSASLTMEPRRSNRVGLIAAIVAVLVVLAGTGGFLVYSGSLAGVLGTGGGGTGGTSGNGTNGNGTSGNGTSGNGTNGNGTGGELGNGAGTENGGTNTNQGQNGHDPQNGQGPHNGENGQAGNATGEDAGPGRGPGRRMPTLVLLDSEPSAAVYEDEIYIGKTPLNIRVRAGRSKTLVLKRKGYEDATIELDDTEAKREVELERKRSRNGGRHGASSGKNGAGEDDTGEDDTGEDDKKPDLGNLELE